MDYSQTNNNQNQQFTPFDSNLNNANLQSQVDTNVKNDNFLLGNFYAGNSDDFLTPVVLDNINQTNSLDENQQKDTIGNTSPNIPQTKSFGTNNFINFANTNNAEITKQAVELYNTNNPINYMPKKNNHTDLLNQFNQGDPLLQNTQQNSYSTKTQNNFVPNVQQINSNIDQQQKQDNTPFNGSISTSNNVVKTINSNNENIVQNVIEQKKNTDLSQTKKRKFDHISELLELVIEKKATDLHITAYYPPYLRIDDKLISFGDPITPEEAKNLISQVLTPNQQELLEVNKEVDLSYQHTSKDRFRINAFYQKGSISAAFRLIPNRIRSISELNLPNTLLDIAKLSQGFFLVTGPTGSGKSTTLAAIIQFINENYPKHIITIEDPIEYIYPMGKALIDQRELGTDTHDWNIAMKSALRQDPDVILIGELRDFETIQLAITLAETGHLVFSTLHTNSASQSIDRIIDVFPPHQQQQIRIQLSSTLKGVLSQRLVPLIDGGRTAVVELLLVTNAVQNLIREGKTYQIDNIIATGTDLGMISMEKSIVKLVRQGKITVETALAYSAKPEEVQKLLKSSVI